MGKVIETVADSIAIEILERGVILISKGNELHLYHKNDSKENVFDTEKLSTKLTNKIHGIKKPPNAWDNVLLVYGEKEFLLLEYSEDFKFNEVFRSELSDWISYGLFLNDPNEIVLLTAHSVILRFSYDISESECSLKERISCTDKSTLYCAQVTGDKWCELVVLGGNAFGELLVWQPVKNKEDHEDPLKPKISPLLHRVSAHNGVIFSMDYNKKSHYLITTSDDRSIKWWKVELRTNATSWSEATFQPLSSGYSHLARVFQGRVISDGPNFYALSVGEDSYFCMWNKNGELLFKRRQQYGAKIWNFVYDNNTKTIYTVGSTGNLIAFGLQHVLKEIKKSKNSTILPTLIDEYLAKVKFINENHLIGVTNKNNLVISRFNGEEWLCWERTKVNVDFKCTVLEVCQNVIAICGHKRWIVMEYQENTGDLKILQDKEVLPGVIRSFIFFARQQYLICDDRGSCLIFMNSFKDTQRLVLPKCKEPWITSALLINQKKHIAISNRQGNLLLYKLQEETAEYELKHSVKHPHGNLGATCIYIIEEDLTSALICSTGHDGAINVFSVDFLSNTLETRTRQIIPVAWVEHMEKCHNNIELFLGFNDNHFVAWCKDYDFLLQIPCGGGHRCWHYVINRKANKISLVFIKSKSIRFYEMNLLNKELSTTIPMAKHWHIAPCNTIKVLQQTSSSTYIVITAGDDNLLKIHTFSNCGLKELKEVHCHISNIRCLKVISLNANEFLIFSGGGRAQLCITKVNSSSFHINELINYTLKPENNNCNSKPYNFDPETRLMSLDVKVVNKEDYDIYVGCSDGFIKLLKFNLKNCKINLVAQYFYRKCILQIRYLFETDLILVAGTDGYLRFFNSTLSKCFHQLQHHSSGVNGLFLLYNNLNKSLQILSGGDDQSVTYTKLSLKDLEFRVLRQFCKPYLHTSQVCACALSSNGLYGFTSGLDQLLYKIDLNTGEVVEHFYSCVPDIKGIVLIDDNVCFLYGCGLQIYVFNNS